MVKCKFAVSLLPTPYPTPPPPPRHGGSESWTDALGDTGVGTCHDAYSRPYLLPVVRHIWKQRRHMEHEFKVFVCGIEGVSPCGIS